MTLKTCAETVLRFRDQKEELERENEELRESAEAVGDLAGRLAVKFRDGADVEDAEDPTPIA